MSSSAQSQAVKRACDACHRRKVKCDGVNPCRNCSSAQLACTYNAIPQKKGPKGSRAKVISELRETQRQTSLLAKISNRMNGVAGPPDPANGMPTPGMLTPEFVKECLDFFFNNMYDKAPILDRRRLEQQLPFMEQNKETACLVTSICGFVMLQPGMSLPTGDSFSLDMLPGVNIIASQLLLEECLRMRRSYEYLDAPSMFSLATSFFLFGCYHGIELHDKAWYYLREATTMLQMNNMHKEDTYSQWDATESSRRRRLYWLFFVLERAHAIQRGRPLTLQATIKPPSSQDDPSDPHAHELNNFIMLVKLFHSFNDSLTGTWTKTRGNLSPQHSNGLQKQLTEMLPNYQCQDGQLAELHINQQWLKTTHWQLTNSRITSHSGDGIDWQMPQDLSRELLNKLTQHFPGVGVEHGLIEKLLDIACNITDFLATQPASRNPFSLGPRESLAPVLNVIGVLRHGTYQFMPLLFSKITEILPRLTNPMLQDAPENCASAMANIDIFDGFGNAGMAQPSQMHMQMDTDYDRKFSVADYDKYNDMGGSGSDSGSANAPNVAPMGNNPVADMNSPFGSSPSVMSPSMEFPRHDINSFCNPMQEMVMSPLGPGNGQQHHLMQNQYMGQQQMQQGLPQHHSGLSQSQSMNSFASPQTPNQPMNSASMTPHNMAQGLQHSVLNQMRQAPQRANSFASQPGGQIPRTVGDFHALQRSTTGDLGMAGMGTADMDFSMR